MTRTLTSTVAGCLAALLAAGAAIGSESAESSTSDALVHDALPVLPEAVASFGACALEGHIYVYSGHIGRAHQHSVDNLSKAFRRRKLGAEGEWETLPFETPLQSVSLVAHGSALYRVGGLSAHNAAGDDEDLRSVAAVSKFDPEAKEWTKLPDLPEPRSSHDACIAGSRLIVAGGWNLQGDEKAWLGTTWSLDLDADEPEWEAIGGDAPFRRRAAAAIASETHLWVIGGITSEGAVSSAVDVLDLETGAWSKAPELPSNGFGAAAIVRDGAVITSLMSGAVLELEPGADAWAQRSTLAFPRFFHRFVELAGTIYAVGGAGAGGHLATVEPVLLGADRDRTVVLSWDLETPARARNRQGVVLWQNELHVFGGNVGRGQHDFQPRHFTDESWAIDLTTMSMHARDALPAPRQSMITALDPADREKAGTAAMMRRSSPTAWVLGGFGHDGEDARTWTDVLEYRPRTGRFRELDVDLPESRSQFGVAATEGALWVFGGLGFVPGLGDGEEGFRYPLGVARWEYGAEGADFELTAHEIPRSRRAFGGAVLNGAYWMVGGMGAGFRLVEEVDVFDFEDEAWRTGPAPSTALLSPEMVALDGKLYLAGGLRATVADPSGDGAGRGEFVPNEAVEVFDPAQDEWRRLPVDAPAPSKTLRLFALRDRLLFYAPAADDDARVRIAVVRPGRAAATDARTVRIGADSITE